MITGAPVVLDRLDVLHDLGEELAVEFVRSMCHARSRYEQIFDPAHKVEQKCKWLVKNRSYSGLLPSLPLGKSSPEGISADVSFYQFLPQHAL